MNVDGNKALENIFKRRSIRKYTDQKISKEQIDLILRAAMSAPSAVAKDPWRFILMIEPASRQEAASVLPNGKMLAEAPLGILVCGDLGAAHSESISYLLQDCAAAIENALLAATAIGLGAVWLGVHPREERIAFMKQYFQLPDNIIPVSCLAIGYPDEEKAARDRYNADYIYYESWGN